MIKIKLNSIINRTEKKEFRNFPFLIQYKRSKNILLILSKNQGYFEGVSLSDNYKCEHSHTWNKESDNWEYYDDPITIQNNIE
jgi:hypothetical protein